MKKRPTIDDIDNLLPQTQCQLCEFDGCRPYAEAIILQNEPINKCPPGGVATLKKLAELLDQNPDPYLNELREKQKPNSIAVIRENECIGCTKCIAACPTDAILGSGKKMHTVITDACTGCELCIEPCPVDCIDMLEIAPRTEQQSDRWRKRFQQRNERLEKLSEKKRLRLQQQQLQHRGVDTVEARKAAIAAAIQRVNAKPKGK